MRLSLEKMNINGLWDNDNKRYLIMGLCGDWYYKDKFLQDRVQEIHGEEIKIMPHKIIQ